jgi:exoribonuclease-2
VEKGRLIEFRLHGERTLAVLDRPEGKKNWVAIDASGQARTLAPKQVTYEVAANDAYKPTDIERFLADVEPYLDPSGLEVAWELLSEDSEPTTPAELALLLFSEETPAQCYAAHCLLSDDKIYFKQKGEKYEPRPVSQVEDLKHQLEAAALRDRERQGFVDRVHQVLAGETIEWEASDRSRIEMIERLAAFGEECPNRAAAIELLESVGRPPYAKAAFQLLVELKIWSEHENLHLRRTQLPTYFSTKVLDVSHHCLQDPPPDTETDRLDLTHLKVFTIDDASTTEIDDGLSLEYCEDGRERLWIHIADPTRWMTPGDSLDLEARRRCTTVYLPTGMVPMLPEELATGPMSLNQGQICCALSFCVELTAEGAIDTFTIHPSFIKPTYRLTYDDVDEMLHLQLTNEPEIEALANYAKLRHAWRQSQGSISIHMPENTVKVRGDEVDIQIIDDSRSRQLVAEMMILTGEVAATYAAKHGIPIPFRGQPQPELPPEEELLRLPPGPVRACALRRCMPRSEVGLFVTRHASLGLDHYTQVTSPIRRYADLLAHFQIKAHLRGLRDEELPFSADELKQILLSIGSSVKEANLVERQTNRYWSIEYLRRNAQEVWPTLVLRWIREDENLGSILLEDLGLEFVWRIPRGLAPGDRLQLRVAHADPREDTIHFQPVESDTAQALEV